ncbi:hypothetical protein EJB05_09522, partial [Eragrostis curvula]
MLRDARIDRERPSDAPSPTMSNLGSRLTAAGFAFMLLAVSVGVGSVKCGALLGLVGVLVGANFIAIGVRMAEEPTAPIRHSVFAAGVGGELTAFRRRNLTVLGLAMASSAVTAVVAAEASPLLCFSMFALLLLGLWLVAAGVLGDQSAAAATPDSTIVQCRTLLNNDYSARTPVLNRDTPSRNRAKELKQSTGAPASPVTTVTADEAVASPTTARLRRRNAVSAPTPATTALTMVGVVGSSAIRTATAMRLAPARTPTKPRNKPSLPEPTPATTASNRKAKPAVVIFLGRVRAGPGLRGEVHLIIGAACKELRN